jgi:transcriptional regulator with XRE-family HTH domain
MSIHDRLRVPPLEASRLRVAARVRELRLARRWTQASLSERLGLSQARLSEIERGGGSFTAEQLLEVMRLFNVDVDAFIAPQSVEDELQNALARLGALHLRQAPDALPSARIAGVRAAVRETLVHPRDARLLLALAPVLVTHIDTLNLDVLHDDVATLGFPARVPWLAENVHVALTLSPETPTRDAAIRRAATVLADFLDRHAPAANGATPKLDHLDATARSKVALARILRNASDVSRRWGIVSDLTPSDFADALRAADVHD